MSLKPHCPGTADYSLLKNQCLENIRPFHLGTGGKHQNWLFKIWHFLNLLFMLLATLIGLEMDIFCISPEETLNRQWNFEFIHRSTAFKLLHEGGTRLGWKAMPRADSRRRLSWGGGARGSIYPLSLSLKYAACFALSQNSVTTCLVFVQAGGPGAQDSLLHSFILHSSPGENFNLYRITESQNGRVWKGPLWVI